MVSRANWGDRAGFIKQSIGAAERNRPSQPDDPPRTTRGGVTDPRQTPAGPAGAATRRRRGGMTGMIGDAVGRAEEAQATQQEEGTVSRNQQRRERGLDSAIQQATQRKTTPVVPNMGRQMRTPDVDTPLRVMEQGEPNLGGTQTRNGVSEAGANLSRQSRSRRIIR